LLETRLTRGDRPKVVRSSRIDSALALLLPYGEQWLVVGFLAFAILGVIAAVAGVFVIVVSLLLAVRYLSVKIVIKIDSDELAIRNPYRNYRVRRTDIVKWEVAKLTIGSPGTASLAIRVRGDSRDRKVELLATASIRAKDRIAVGKALQAAGCPRMVAKGFSEAWVFRDGK
jgi:hypothetical protein